MFFVRNDEWGTDDCCGCSSCLFCDESFGMYKYMCRNKKCEYFQTDFIIEEPDVIKADFIM